MNTADAKRVLETALICSQQPLQVRDLRTLFDDRLGADTLKVLLQSCSGMGTAWGRVGQRGNGMAISKPTRDAGVPGQAAP